MKKCILSIFLLIFLVSCKDVPTEPQETDLKYNFLITPDVKNTIDSLQLKYLITPKNAINIKKYDFIVLYDTTANKYDTLFYGFAFFTKNGNFFESNFELHKHKYTTYTRYPFQINPLDIYYFENGPHIPVEFTLNLGLPVVMMRPKIFINNTLSSNSQYSLNCVYDKTSGKLLYEISASKNGLEPQLYKIENTIENNKLVKTEYNYTHFLKFNVKYNNQGYIESELDDNRTGMEHFYDSSGKPLHNIYYSEGKAIDTAFYIYYDNAIYSTLDRNKYIFNNSEFDELTGIEQFNQAKKIYRTYRFIKGSNNLTIEQTSTAKTITSEKTFYRFDSQKRIIEVNYYDENGNLKYKILSAYEEL